MSFQDSRIALQLSVLRRHEPGKSLFLLSLLWRYHAINPDSRWSSWRGILHVALFELIVTGRGLDKLLLAAAWPFCLLPELYQSHGHFQYLVAEGLGIQPHQALSFDSHVSAPHW